MNGNGKEAHSKVIITESVVIVDDDGKMRDKFGMVRLGDGEGPGKIFLD